MIETEARPVSSLCVASAALGVVATAAFATLTLWPAAVIGLVTAVVALRSCNRYQQVGSRWAWAGLAASSASLLGAPVLMAALYRNESPPGYRRVHFDAVSRDDYRGLDVFDGQRICLKGYAYPEKQTSGLKRFLFTPDGDPRLKGRGVGVLMPDGESWDYRSGPIAVSGVLVPNEQPQGHDPLFLLKESVVRPSRTSFDLVPLTRRGC